MEEPLRLTRRRSDRIAAGVAGGLADTLRVNASFVRAAFVSLAAVWGLGLFLYVFLWLVTFDKVEDREVEPVGGQQGFGLGLAFLGLLLLMGTLGWWPSTAAVAVVTAISFGVAALTDRDMSSPLSSILEPDAKQPGRVRIVLGVVLLVGGLAVLAGSVGPVARWGTVLLAVALTGLGLLIGFGPWVRRLGQDLGEERRERIRQEERAEMAAHLHDSVLQTLALIQRSDDPARMSMLARHQEGELREWLYGHTPLDGVDLVSTALKGIAHRVEQDHQIPIEVVTVGDVPLTEAIRPVLGAANEALVNAAKHSGASSVSAYMEVDDGTLEIIVTDQGKGFDLNRVRSDRKGIERSIVARAEKAGAKVSIESEPGEGTEVAIRVAVGQ